MSAGRLCLAGVGAAGNTPEAIRDVPRQHASRVAFDAAAVDRRPPSQFARCSRRPPRRRGNRLPRGGQAAEASPAAWESSAPTPLLTWPRPTRRPAASPTLACRCSTWACSWKSTSTGRKSASMRFSSTARACRSWWRVSGLPLIRFSKRQGAWSTSRPALSDGQLLDVLERSHAAVRLPRWRRHTEFRLTTSRGPRLMEINARLGGDMIPYMGQLAGWSGCGHGRRRRGGRAPSRRCGAAPQGRRDQLFSIRNTTSRSSR